jgi:hypothetical protein
MSRDFADLKEEQRRANELISRNIVDTAIFDALAESQRKRDQALERVALIRRKEAELVEASRKNAISLAALTSQLLDGGIALSTEIEKALKRQKDSADFSAKEGLNLVRQLSAITRLGNEAAKFAIQMERLVLGEPTGDPESDTGEKKPAEWTLDEAEQWISTAADAVKRRRQREKRHEDANSNPATPGDDSNTIH